MKKLLKWIRWAVRALLIFIAATSLLGVSYWMVERYTVRDLIAVAMVGLGWFGFAYLMFRRSRPRTSGEW